MPSDTPGRGYTTGDVAALLRVGQDKIVNWIRRGDLRAVNVSSALTGRPRYIVLPDHLEEFLRCRSAAEPPKPPRSSRRKQLGYVEYF